MNGGSDYNRYKLQFDLLPMVVACFVRKNILIPCESLQDTLKFWAYNPHNKKYQCVNNKSWQTSILWRLNSVHQCGWQAGKSEERKQKSYSDMSDKKSRLSTSVAGIFGYESTHESRDVTGSSKGTAEVHYG